MRYRPILITGALLAVLAAGFVWRGEWLITAVLRARFSPEVTMAERPAPRDQAEANRQDVDDLATLLDYDRSFSPAQRKAFQQGIEELRPRAGSLEPAAFDLAVAKLVALSGNGHSGARLYARLDRYGLAPVRLAWFEEGLFVIAATDSVPDALARKVTAIDGHPVEEAFAAVRPYLSGTDEHARIDAMRFFFICPAFLHAVWPDADAQSLTLTLDDGDQRFSAETPETAEPLRWLPAAEAFSHLYGGQTAELYTRPFGHEGVYVRMNKVWSGDSTPLQAQLAAVAAATPPGGWRWMVLDLRFNSGGDYTRTLDFTKRLPDLLAKDGKLWLLTGNDTFSAAIVTLARAKYFVGDRAHIVGEKVGDHDAFWGETGKPFVLRNSGLGINYATGLHDWVHGCGDPRKCFWLNFIFGVAAGDLSPERQVKWRFSDFIEGRDTVIDTVLSEN